MEFSIARWLVDYRLAGNKLPETLPISLIPFGYPVHSSVRKKLEQAEKEASALYDKTATKQMFRVGSDLTIYSMEQLTWTVADWSIWASPEQVEETYNTTERSGWFARRRYVHFALSLPAFQERCHFI